MMRRVDANGGAGRARASTIIEVDVPIVLMSDNDNIDAAAKFHDKFIMMMMYDVLFYSSCLLYNIVLSLQRILFNLNKEYYSI